MNKKKLLTYVAATIVVIGLGIGLYFAPHPAPKEAAATNDGNVANEPAETPTVTDTSFFDNSAKVQLFYSESCGWCQKEKVVLSELAKEGYRVKPMDVGTNQDYWKTYNIEGTPTFVAPDGERKVGYQEKDALKTFLDKYK